MTEGDLTAALPEIFLALAGMVLLLLGVFRRKNSTALVLLLSVLALTVALVLLWIRPQPAAESVAFGGS